MFEKNVVVMIKQTDMGGYEAGPDPIGWESFADFVRVKVSAESQEALDKVVQILVDYRPGVKETHCCMFGD